MKYVTDRVPGEGMANKFKITKTDGSSETVTLVRADAPIEEGTDVDRELLMNVQGFYASTIVFNDDGSITETNADGDTVTTTFPEGAIAVDTFKQTSTGQTIAVKTTIDETGNIKKELV